MEELRREREYTDLAEILPSCDTKRWVARRKAAVVIAVREGVISRGKACDWYQLSSEELASWEVAFKEFGTTGLRASYRFPEIRASALRQSRSGAAPSPATASSVSQARGRLGVQRGPLLRAG